MVKSGEEQWADATFKTDNWKSGTVGFRSPKSAGVSPQALSMVTLGASLGAVSQWEKQNQRGALKSDGVKTHEMVCCSISLPVFLNSTIINYLTSTFQRMNSTTRSPPWLATKSSFGVRCVYLSY